MPTSARTRSYIVTVYAVGDDGRSQTLVGTVTLTASTRREAIRLAYDDLWDERLTAASCHPRYMVTLTY